MVHQQNYPVERHTVQTKDGYMLTMYRMPNMNEQRDNRKVIILMHGKNKFFEYMYIEMVVTLEFGLTSILERNKFSIFIVTF